MTTDQINVAITTLHDEANRRIDIARGFIEGNSANFITNTSAAMILASLAKVLMAVREVKQ
jgi:hypothetical protein